MRFLLAVAVDLGLLDDGVLCFPSSLAPTIQQHVERLGLGAQPLLECGEPAGLGIVPLGNSALVVQPTSTASGIGRSRTGRGPVRRRIDGLIRRRLTQPLGRGQTLALLGLDVTEERGPERVDINEARRPRETGLRTRAVPLDDEFLTAGESHPPACPVPPE